MKARASGEHMPLIPMPKPKATVNRKIVRELRQALEHLDVRTIPRE
jgi:hypothetical protein